MVQNLQIPDHGRRRRAAPGAADEAARYADHVRRRLVVKPGLTRLWQVKWPVRAVTVLVGGSGAQLSAVLDAERTDASVSQKNFTPPINPKSDSYALSAGPSTEREQSDRHAYL